MLQAFEDLTIKLSSRVDDLMASRQAVPAELPAPLPQPNVKFKANRRRGYTGREVAEEEEKDAIRAARRATREADLRRFQDATRRQDLWAEKVATRVTERRRQEAHVAPNPVPPVHQSSPHVTAPPAEVIEISSGDSDEIS